MTFRVGQKVVCIDDAEHPGVGPWDGVLRRGEIYTVRWIGPYRRTSFDPEYIGVRLVGIDRTNGGKLRDTPFHKDRFRPIVERKTETGMAILREILDRESHQDRVPEKARP